jgi:hypothetical protein
MRKSEHLPFPREKSLRSSSSHLSNRNHLSPKHRGRLQRMAPWSSTRRQRPSRTREMRSMGMMGSVQLCNQALVGRTGSEGIRYAIVWPIAMSASERKWQASRRRNDISLSSQKPARSRGVRSSKIGRAESGFRSRALSPTVKVGRLNG